MIKKIPKKEEGVAICDGKIVVGKYNTYFSYDLDITVPAMKKWLPEIQKIRKQFIEKEKSL